MILTGDCLDTLKTLESNSIDSVVTDPPYGLKFMGKKWDYEVPSVEIWKEVLRVLKPGGHVLSFCGTRTYHRMVVNMEDAGLEIRDQLQWIYGSGFPKSHDVSKAIDKAAGAEREVIGHTANARPNRVGKETKLSGKQTIGGEITLAQTNEAKQWQGWGTALKPANEPICLARKPIEGTVAQNVLKYGVGGLNIDATRIATNGETLSFGSREIGDGTKYSPMPKDKQTPGIQNAQGRFPANVLFDESAAEILDAQSGKLNPGGQKRSQRKCEGVNTSFGSAIESQVRHTDSGGASRFFYVAKASKSERNAGMGDEVKQKQGARPKSADASGKFPDHDHRETGGNNHPTVKPLKLMQYLIKLITPPGGVCLDPFMGSGTTGVAAKSLGFEFIGCELSPEYVAIAEKRIEHQEAVS